MTAHHCPSHPCPICFPHLIGQCLPTAPLGFASPTVAEWPRQSDARDAIALKIAAYDEALTKLGRQEVHARGILNFARAEMFDVLKVIATEARRAGAGNTGSTEGESPVPQGCAQTGSSTHPHRDNKEKENG